MSTKTENSRSLLTRATLSTRERAKANAYQSQTGQANPDELWFAGLHLNRM